MAFFGRSLSKRKSDCGPEDLLNDKLLNALRKDSVDDAIIKEELHSSTKEDVFPAVKAKWQRLLVHLMHSTPVEILIVSLVIIDVIILLTMLVLELHILELKLGDGAESTEQTIAFLRLHCNKNEKLANYSGQSLLTALRAVKEIGCHESEGDLSSIGSLLHHGNSSTADLLRHKRAAAVVDPDGGSNSEAIHKMEVAEHVLHFCSIFILGIMVVEVVLKVAGLGKAYFRGKMEIIDGIVIFISFGMDLYFYRGIFADGFSNMATILVIFLLWRIARIFNAILVTAKTRLEFRIRVQKRARTHLNERITVLQTDIETLQEHVENLRLLCRNYKISEDALQAAEPLVVTSRRKSTSKALGSVLKMSVNLASGLGLTPNPGSRRPSMAISGRAAQSGTPAERASLLAPSADANANIPSTVLPTVKGEPAGMPLQNGTNHVTIGVPSKGESSSADGDTTADNVPLLDRRSLELRQPASAACTTQTTGNVEPSSDTPSYDTSPGSCCSDITSDSVKMPLSQLQNSATVGTSCRRSDESADRSIAQPILGVAARRSLGGSEGCSEGRFSQASLDGHLNVLTACDITTAVASSPQPTTNGTAAHSDGPYAVVTSSEAVNPATFDTVAKQTVDQVVIIMSEH